MEMWQIEFINSIYEMAEDVHETAKSKGWWDTERSPGEIIALIHSELSECLEAYRHGNPQDQHLPNFDSATVEIADVIIRCLDWAAHENMDLAEAIIAKVEYNKTRRHKHGGKAF